MSKRFHEKEFDNATQIKLAIFRGYIRKWLPVFLTNRTRGRNFQGVNIYDFFAGPGTDKEGNPGSPLIIQDELKNYCETNGEIKAHGIAVCLYFNDKIKKHIRALKKCLEENACTKKCCEPHLSSKPFQESFADSLSSMQDTGIASLVIMDQFGIKEVTPEVVNVLSQCPTTDTIFFVSSSAIRRFADEPVFREYFHLEADELAASDYKSIHRHICEYFRSKLRVGAEYYLAPFSIKKGSNIYGVIFGSRSLFGLQKFLEVCWDLDNKTGEANYDIDDEPTYSGQLSLFPEDNIPKKENKFQQELREMLSCANNSLPITNLDVYRFTLEKGFLPKHANSYFKELQKDNKLEVINTETGKAARRGAFYLGWAHYRDEVIKAHFRFKE